MCDIIFEKIFLKRLWGQNECLCRNNRPKSSLKKVKFHEIHTKTSVWKNKTLAQVFSCEL